MSELRRSCAMSELRPVRNIIAILTCGLTGLIVAGCPNNVGTGSTSGGLAATDLTGPSGAPGTPAKPVSRFTIVKANAEPASSSGASGGSGASGASGSEQPPNFTLIFNANSDTRLTDVCRTKTANNPSMGCKCTFTWSLPNTSDPTVVTRVAMTDATVTSFEAKCPGPVIYNDSDEIPDSTVIKIQLVPDAGAGNNSGFQTNVVTFTKEPLGSTGDFRDSEGRAFRNILHYVCYDMISKNLAVDRVREDVTEIPKSDGTTEKIAAYAANKFAVSGGDQPIAYSGQSYYYDFYVRSDERGSINAGSGGYTCPRVNVSGQPDFFPMDSQFAVALQKSNDFPIAITGRTIAGPSGGPAGNIIGYAAKPNADGTCPSFFQQNRILRTFRLRQYMALYPLRYNADGKPIDKSQPNNVVYVLDRPVTKAGVDPGTSKPITRLGPKPCPFSFKTAQFGQKCMTDAALTGWSIDGTQINGSPKCPIYPPVNPKHLKADGTLVIRPYKSFLSHYLENTSLRACAFPSSTPVDPEIVLSHDKDGFPGGPSDFYCAKYYPPAGSIIPPAGGTAFDKIPGDCDTTASAAAIKGDKTYSCLRTYDPTNSTLPAPAAGCCQICSGPDCRAQGGGITAAGRNAVFSPPHDASGGVSNPPRAAKSLPRAQPNTSAAGCFDPYED